MKSAYTVTSLEARGDGVLAWRAALETSLPRLAEMGYDGIELMVKSPEDFDVEAAQRVLQRTGLQVAAIGTGPIAQERGLTLSAADEAIRRQAISATEAALRLCARWGACLTIGAFRGRCETAEVPSARKRLAASFEQLLPVAEKLGVRICLEPQNRFQSSFFRTVAETLPLIKELGSAYLGLSLDTFHMNVEESSLEDACHAASQRVFYVQLADNHRGPPGTGLLPLSRVKRSLDQIGYDGWISMEIAQTSDPGSAALAAIDGFHRFSRSNSIGKVET